MWGLLIRIAITVSFDIAMHIFIAGSLYQATLPQLFDATAVRRPVLRSTFGLV